MPKTKLESIVFSVLMVLTMVYAMELYNIALANNGLAGFMFTAVLEHWIPLSLVVLVVETLIVGPIARTMALSVFNPAEDKPIFVILAISACTVAVMCPMISLIATVWFKHPGDQLVTVWLETTVYNLPMAFFWQIFYAGPFVRFIFRHLQVRVLPTPATSAAE